MTKLIKLFSDFNFVKIFDPKPVTSDSIKFGGKRVNPLLYTPLLDLTTMKRQKKFNFGGNRNDCKK